MHQVKDEADKNHDETDTEASKKGRVYEIRGFSLCPVKTYELYISRLHPMQKRLWQTPRMDVTWDDEVWYDNDKLGKNRIQGLMPSLVTDAGFQDKTLTNHCIRSTCITVLDNNGFEAHHIMCVSGHKREESIKLYASRVPFAKKREMSNALSSVVVPKKQKIETISKPTGDENVINESENSNMSFRDLLELSQEEESALLKELLSDEPFSNEVQNVNPQPLNVTNTIQNVSTVRPSNQQVVPKMVFQNSNITINFNITKP